MRSKQTSRNSQMPPNSTQPVEMSNFSISTFTGNHDRSESMDATLQNCLREKVLNCPICKKLLKTPVFLVDNFGNVCQKCTPFVPPDLHRTPNTIVDVMLNGLTHISCENEASGCEEDIPYGEFEAHVEVCKYRPIKCLMQPLCQWTGKPDDFRDHFMEVHHENEMNISDREDQIQGSTFELDMQQSGAFVKMLLKHPLQFIFVCKLDTKAEELSCSLFKFQENAPCSTTIVFRNSEGKQFSFKININPLHLIDLQGSVEKISLTALKDMFQGANSLTMIVNLPPDDSLLQNLECVICMEIMRAPIYQCNHGHTFCKNCVGKLPSCPTCTAQITKKIRNYRLENLSSEMFYCCAFKGDGCGAVVLGDAVNDHESNCLYRTYQCPLLHCDFKYNHENVTDHVTEKHADMTNKFEFNCGYSHYSNFTHDIFSTENSFRSTLYAEGCFLHFKYTFHQGHNYRYATAYASLKFRRCNNDEHVKDLYCKITMRNLSTNDELVMARSFKKIEHCRLEDWFTIFVPIEALGDAVDRTRQDCLQFICEIVNYHPIY